MCDVYMGSWLESLRKNGYVMSFVLNLSMITFSQIKYIKKKLKHDAARQNKKKFLYNFNENILWDLKSKEAKLLCFDDDDYLVINLFFTLFLPHLNHIPIINKNLLIHMLIIIFICGAFSLPFFYLILSTSPL